jgi:NADPH:quinone reductase-like Zn-dependent oxidoreductase
MRAIFFRRSGRPEVLEEGDLPTPEPGPGQVRLRVLAAALNHLDVWVRRDASGVPMPHIGGSDVVGTVDAVGRGVRIPRGARGVLLPTLSCGRCALCKRGEETLCKKFGILGSETNGGLAEYVVAPVRNFVRVPDTLPDEVAAAYPLTALTAYRMLVTKAHVRRGETVLVHGAGGGLSSIGIQIARVLGARVIATTGSAAKVPPAKALGAFAVIDYRSEDVLRRVLELTDGEGVDLVFENVGRETFGTSLQSLKKGGRIVTAGASSGGRFPVDIGDVYWRQLSVVGSTMGGRHEFAAVSRLVFTGKVRPAIDRVQPLTAVEVRAGHEALEAGSQFGKIVFRVSGSSGGRRARASSRGPRTSGSRRP